MSEQIKALVIPEKGAKQVIELVKKPSPKPYVHNESSGELLIKVKAIALNPIDWKQAEYGILIDGYPVTLGCDVAGVIEAVGEGVTEFAPGEEICGFAKLGVPGGYGAFSEYTILDAASTYRKPPHLSFEEAATIPVCTITAAVGLFDALKLPLPSENYNWFQPEYVLICGGASSVGSYAVQLAAYSGLSVIATASPKNHQYLNSIGAEYVVDYNASDAAEQIKAISKNRLRYVLDAVGSANLGVASLGSNGKLAHVNAPPSVTKEGIETIALHVGVAHKDPNALKTVHRLIKEVEPLVADGRIRPSNVEIVPGGLDSIIPGLEKLKKGVSATKLVVVVD